MIRQQKLPDKLSDLVLANFDNDQIKALADKYNIVDQTVIEEALSEIAMFHSFNKQKKQLNTKRQTRDSARSIAKYADKLVSELFDLDIHTRRLFFSHTQSEHEDKESGNYLQWLINWGVASVYAENEDRVVYIDYNIVGAAIQLLALKAEDIIDDIDELENETGLKAPPRKNKANLGLSLAIGGLREIWEEQTGKPFTRQFNDPIVEDGEELLPISEAAHFCVDCMALIDSEVTTRMIDRAMRENITLMGVSFLK